MVLCGGEEDEDLLLNLGSCRVCFVSEVAISQRCLTTAEVSDVKLEIFISSYSLPAYSIWPATASCMSPSGLLVSFFVVAVVVVFTLRGLCRSSKNW